MRIEITQNENTLVDHMRWHTYLTLVYSDVLANSTVQSVRNVGVICSPTYWTVADINIYLFSYLALLLKTLSS